MHVGPETFLTRPGGVRVCYQTFGPKGATPVLLLSGGAQSMSNWHEDFISMVDDRLRGALVIRFDYRDTGRSTNPPLGEAAHYSIHDLCNDAVAILDELLVESANLVGFSLGGALAWMIAAQHPQRVKSLSLFSSSPVGPTIVHGREDRNIPLAHAEALKEDIKGSRLVVLEGMAHEMPKREWPRFAHEIAATCV